jgi:hypothetical protein
MQEAQAQISECAISQEIEDSEKLVRTIKTPWHLNKRGVPRPASLRPGPEVSAVSVIRHLMGDDFCKDQSVRIAGPSYIGLLVLSSGGVRATGTTAYDHRADFCGHAHIDHGMTMPARGVPLPPEVEERLQERCEAILKCGSYHLDPLPQEPGWKGHAL